MSDIPPRFSVMFKIVRVDNSVYPPVSTVDALCKTFFTRRSGHLIGGAIMERYAYWRLQ